MLSRCEHCYCVIDTPDLIMFDALPFHKDCKIVYEYRNHNVIVAIKSISAKTKRLLECNPEEIVKRKKRCKQLLKINKELDFEI